MALIEGVGDDVTVVVFVLTLGLGFIAVMYLRLLESVHRNATVRDNGPLADNTSQYADNSPEVQTEHHQRHEDISNQLDVDEVSPQNAPSCDYALGQESVDTCASSNDRLTAGDGNNSELETEDFDMSHNVDATPAQNDDRGETSTTTHAEPSESGEDSTRNRFHSSHVESNHERTHSTDVVLVRVKFNERNMDIEVPKTATVLEFKRLCFPREVEEGKLVRLIYSGRLLDSDHRSLEDCGVSHLSVIHCQISDTRREPERQETDSELDLGPIFAPLLGVVLAGFWYAYHSHPTLFNTTSLVILLFLTVLYSLFLFATMSSQGSPQ